MKEQTSFDNAKNTKVEIAFTYPLSSITPYKIYITFILKVMIHRQGISL